jgi:hypothetical protein
MLMRVFIMCTLQPGTEEEEELGVWEDNIKMDVKEI